MTYYNTTHLADDSRERRNARRQEAIVLSIFEKSAGRTFTPWEIAATVPFPITSVRRAITNLTEAGQLEKTGERRAGPYGKVSYCWRLKPAQPKPETQPELF